MSRADLLTVAFVLTVCAVMGWRAGVWLFESRPMPAITHPTIQTPISMTASSSQRPTMTPLDFVPIGTPEHAYTYVRSPCIGPLRMMRCPTVTAEMGH